MPKRSASSITMTVASGTSTPTSITVVATRTSMRAAAEARHRAVPCRPPHLAVQQAERGARASVCWASRSASATADFASMRSEPSTSGQTT